MPPISPTEADEPLRAGPALQGLHAMPTAEGLRQLLRAALPDKSRQTAQGWFGDTDFLLTRAHVDEDGDTYHDGLFLTVWQQWEFWMADTPRPTHASLLHAAADRAGRWLRRQPPAAAGFTQLYRRHQPGSGAGGGPWHECDVGRGEGPPEAITSCIRAWQGLLDYWSKGVAQRRAHYPLRQKLLSCCTPESIEALALLPAFMPAATGTRRDLPMGGWQVQGPVITRPPTHATGSRNASFAGAALRVTWPRAQAEAPPWPISVGGWEATAPDHGAEGDTLACYQIEVQRDPLRHGEAGVEITYAQRLSDTREPLPPEAADHIERLLQLVATAVQALLAACPPGDHAAHAFQWLAAAADHPTHAPDEAVLPPMWMALSHAWQTAGRAHAAAQRRRDDTSATGAAVPLPPPPLPSPSHHWPDPRALHAPRVLQLAREISRRRDAATAERFHRRFAFAPGCHADRSQADGLPVGPVGWLADGSIAARVGQGDGQWFRLERETLLCVPLAADEAWASLGMGSAAGPAQAQGAAAWIDGLAVQGDAQGVLWGRDAAGRVLWRHPVGTSQVTAVALSADGRGVLVGTAGGDLVVLRKAGGRDPFGTGDSRYAEGWRGLFWEGEDGMIWW